MTAPGTDGIPEKSSLISAELEEQLKPILTKFEHAVRICCIGKPEEKSSAEMISFLKHLASLCPLLKPEFYLPEENSELSRELDSSLLPATGLYRGDAFTGIVFHGVPGGQEINSFILALYNAAGPGQKLEPKLAEKIRGLKKAVDVRIYVSLSCHHCSQAVTTAQRMAAENPLIHAHMVDARLYPEIIEKYKIERVPKTIINGQVVMMGELDPEELYRQIHAVKPAK